MSIDNKLIDDTLEAITEVMKSVKEMRDDIVELTNTLDGVLDNFDDVCGYRDADADALIEKMRERYGKETKEGEENASKEN